MSLAIKVNNQFLELQPGTQIQRERVSPFFLSKATGRDGIPGEVSYPFSLPLTDNNMRALGHPDYLPSIRNRIVDNVVYDDINQVTAGKLQLGKASISLSRNNVGSQEVNLLCNSSAFAKLIEGKKMTELSMGGDREFGWAGFNLTNPGFWKHIHDTWDYANCDDGDYVFFPVKNETYGAFVTYQNKPITDTVSDMRVRLTSDNVMSLTPHVYLHYIIRCIFEEHGYTVGGAIMEDADFKQVCMLSFKSVYWSDIRMKPSQDGWTQLPLPLITLRIGEHMPPDWTIGQFLVELCKLLPLGLDINDNSKRCTLRLLGQPSQPGQLKDMTGKIDPTITTIQNTDKLKTVSITRNFGTDTLNGRKVDTKTPDWIKTRQIESLPLPVLAPVGAVYLVKNENAYYVKVDIDGVVTTSLIGYANGDYVVPDSTETINTAMVPVGQTANTTLLRYPPTSPSVWPTYILPTVGIEGNWDTKPTQSTWGVHLCFYKGRSFPLNNATTYLAPYATPTNNLYTVGSGGPLPIIDGAWSFGYDHEDSGLIKVFWKEWLKILSEQEKIEGRLHLPLHEYLQLNWGDEILIENTSYLLTKLQDVLPYTGTVQFEAIRWIKGT